MCRSRAGTCYVCGLDRRYDEAFCTRRTNRSVNGTWYDAALQKLLPSQSEVFAYRKP